MGHSYDSRAVLSLTQRRLLRTVLRTVFVALAAVMPTSISAPANAEILVYCWGIGPISLENGANGFLENDWYRQCRKTNFSRGPSDILIRGEITQQDALTFKTLIANRVRLWGKLFRDFMWVHLNSPGGDVAAAMEIGRIVRDGEMTAAVDEDGSCASACVLILASGIRRVIAGTVIIHRPDMAQAAQSGGLADADNWDTATRDRIADYLREMNIPTSLADDMMAVPPERGKSLSESDLALYMLTNDDPADADKMIAIGAEIYGLTMFEYRARHVYAFDRCGVYFAQTKFDDFSNCYLALMLTISEDEAKQRIALEKQQCNGVKPQEDLKRCIRKALTGQ